MYGEPKVRLSPDLAAWLDTLDEAALNALENACSIRKLQMLRTDLPLDQILERLAQIKPVLDAQGKLYHGLDSWEWREGAIKFWLNPFEQDLYNSGWFSIDELVLWARDIGPVMLEVADEEDEPDLLDEIRWLTWDHAEIFA